MPQTLRFTIPFLSFRKTEESEKFFAEDSPKDEEKTDFRRLRCPICRWQPKASSVWYCGDCPHPEHFFGGCGTAWNTFETRGLCPGCRHRWKWTMCLRCGGWSPHDEWYSDGKE